jgi:predicted DCC family thiol-disulfide oxidoreductase YuxK
LVFHGGATTRGVGNVAVEPFVDTSRNMPAPVVLSTLTMPADIMPARDSLLPPRVVRVTVWHDGGCPLCAREIALMRHLDRRGAIAFVDVTEPSAVCPRSRSELLARFYAREEGPLGSGPMLSGAAAFAAMWRAIPLLRPLGLLARNAIVLGLLERLYSRFLVVRPRLQQWLSKREARA